MNPATSTVNLILDGGTIATSASGVGFAGSITVNSGSTFGTGNIHVTTITSTLAGSGTLFLRSADGTPTLTFAGGLTSFSGYTGTLNIGWLDNDGAIGRLLVDFNQNYVIPGAIVMNNGVGFTQDILQLDQAITVNAFSFGGTSLAAGTYTSAQLESNYMTTNRFTGPGTLTVVPEPSAVLLGALGSLSLLRRRRAV